MSSPMVSNMGGVWLGLYSLFFHCSGNVLLQAPEKAIADPRPVRVFVKKRFDKVLENVVLKIFEKKKKKKM